MSSSGNPSQDLANMADDRLEITIDNDALTVTVSVSPGDALPSGTVAATLDAEGVVHGIDESAVQEIENRLEDEQFSIESKQVAHATAMVPGSDGELVLNFDPGPHAGKMRSDGSLDLLNRGLLRKVSRGDSLGYVKEPSLGTPGITVLGDEIPTVPGKESSIQFGDGIELGEGGAVSAARDGAVQFRPGSSLDVIEHYEHQGNVDIKSGHLETNGSVTITGEVKANFDVRAGGDVEVRGAVIGGRIAAGGSVQVMGAIAAGEDGRVRAEGDIRAKHAQIARLRSAGGIMLATDCVGSDVRARSIEVGRSLLGGEVMVESSISTAVAGSPSGAGTVLRVAEPYECDREAHVSRSASNKALRQISRRKSPSSRNGRSAKGKRSRANASIGRDEAKRHIERAAARAKLLKTAVIDVATTVNVGVQVKFGTRLLDIDVTLGATRFRFDEEANCIIMETP